MLNGEILLTLRAISSPLRADGAAAGRRAAAAAPAAPATRPRPRTATGQSLLVKNSSHSVWPIIIEPEPARRSGITNSPTIGMKQSSAPAPTPGNDSGNVTSQNALPRRRAEIACGFQQRGIHPGERRIERQDHERQIGIDDADIHRGVGREPHHRRRDQMQREQNLVQQAVMLQDVDPGIDADQERGPERHDHQHHRDRLPALRQPRHAVGDGIADQQQDQGRGHRDDEAAQIGADVEIVGDQQPEIIQRQLREGRLDRRPPFA